MTGKILGSVVAGVVLGYFLLPVWVLDYTDLIIDIGLMLLLFFVGIDIGINRFVFGRIRNMGLRIVLIPVMIIGGSILGSALAGLILGMPFNEAGAVGAGLGWYTLSSILMANYSNELSTLAFLANVVREMLAFIIIPIVAKKLGFFSAIGPAGATAMDTGLPIISRATDSETAIVAFISGAICTFSVPILVPLILNL
ncbi:lysine exporter LysO family protein [Gudongella sp. DL1XJH-153]|uniref:lysine exporter LysO family protein n=1 Tax=Gudongella sp. DL1XJH-153 TaxID=3409804 RepID=UPI003BB5A4CE